MNNKINDICLPRLHNEEYFGFHSEFAELVAQYRLTESFLSLVAIYSEHYDALSGMLENIRKSVLTGQLVDAHRQRNASYRSLRSAVRGYMRHSDPAKQLSAKRLFNVIRHFNRAATRGSREERTYAIENMIEELHGATAADLQLPGLSDWVFELETNNRACKGLKELRYAEREKKTEQDVKKFRRILDTDYKAIVMYLKVHGVLNPNEENYRNLVVSLNERVGFYTRLIAQRRGIAAARKIAQPEPDLNLAHATA